MTNTSRAAAAITSGFLPALVAFIVLLLVDGNWPAALISALIIGVGLSIVMWFRLGKRKM